MIFKFKIVITLKIIIIIKYVRLNNSIFNIECNSNRLEIAKLLFYTKLINK